MFFVNFVFVGQLSTIPGRAFSLGSLCSQVKFLTPALLGFKRCGQAMGKKGPNFPPLTTRVSSLWISAEMSAIWVSMSSSPPPQKEYGTTCWDTPSLDNRWWGTVDVNRGVQAGTSHLSISVTEVNGVQVEGRSSLQISTWGITPTRGSGNSLIGLMGLIEKGVITWWICQP